MPISTGMRLGPYEVRERVGAGGMGEVYRAHDSRLDRDVAIKISAERFTERFEREARAIAALNHPHICTLYDIGPNYLVMEYIEGVTLSERIRAGAIPIEEALPIAKQVAEALESAHEKGVIHRDLKPANIKLTPQGNVKVLDFGLAAIRQGSALTGTAPEDSPTLTWSGAKAGVILGTAGYMSPEQVRGLPVDKRADIWAYGVVLYEMLTGRQLFPGDTISDKLAAALKDAPDWNVLPPKTPVAIRRLLRRCMERDRKNRLQDIGDARLEIDEAVAAQEDTLLPGTPQGRRSLWAGVTLVVTLVGFGLAAVHFRGPQPPEIATVLSVQPPENAINVERVSVSPDGRNLAFVAATKISGSRIYVRSLDTATARPLNGTDGAGTPFWSSDGRFLAFTVSPRPNKLLKIPVAGGPPQTLGDSDVAAAGTWGAMETILIGRLGDGLFRVSASNGAVTRLTTPDASRDERRHAFPYFLPGGRQFLYVAASDKPGKSVLYAASLDSAKRTPIMPVESNVSFVSSRTESTRGYLLFLREGALLAQPFDVQQLRTTGDSFVVAERVGSRGVTGSPIRHGCFSASGSTLAYCQDTARSQQLAWFSRSGQRLGVVGRPSTLAGFALSPDGRHVATVVGDFAVRNADLLLIDNQRGSSLPLTFGRGLGGVLVFSPDGTSVAFSDRHDDVGTIVQKSTSGTGPEKKLLESHNLVMPTNWSRDGKYLAYTVLDSQSRGDIWILPLAEGRKPFPLITTPASETFAQFSPDGKWIAYISDEGGATSGGTPQIYVQPFAAEATNPRRWPISVNGGRGPRWRDDGKELFYFEGSKIMAVEIRASGENFEAGIPKELFEAPPPGTGNPMLAVSADGQRFLLPVQVESDAAAPITLLLNWTSRTQK
jgi:Tol biopolymer transport system component/predicted Ser/Thr protein kinase